jgi:hypothetical protein
MAKTFKYLKRIRATSSITDSEIIRRIHVLNEQKLCEISTTWRYLQEYFVFNLHSKPMPTFRVTLFTYNVYEI